jgi:protein phosphatase
MSEPASSDVQPQRRLIVRAVLRSDVGLVRSENQDFGTYTTPDEERRSHPGGRLLIVADGMGGHRGGATASRLAAETVKAQYLGAETADVAVALRDSLARANARIFHEAQSNPELRGMGTTTSALAVRNGVGWFAHVGDSRIYLVREGEIQQLTDDHSLVATMVREGLLTSAEAETHPRRNVLQRSMGVAEQVEIDIRGPIELREGDTFILCSDGLHGVVKEPELLDVAKMPLDSAADEFLRRALTRGAPDNVTVIVARVEATDEPEAAREVGDETLIDHDDTQPLDPIDFSQFDETQKETDRLPPIHEVPMPEPISPAAAGPAAAAANAASATATTGTTTIETPAPPATAAPRTASAPAPKSSALAWIIILAIVLGSAAGAWYYWNQQQTASRDAHPASSPAR